MPPANLCRFPPPSLAAAARCPRGHAPPARATPCHVWHRPALGTLGCRGVVSCVPMPPRVAGAGGEPKVEGRPPGSEPRLPFASQWVFSSLKCCGKRLPLLPRHLLLLRWKQKPFVRAGVKQFGLEELSGCSEPTGPSVPGSRRGSGQEKASPGLCWCSGTRPHPYQLMARGQGVTGKGTPPGHPPLAPRSPQLCPLGCWVAQLFSGLPKR